MSSRFSLATLLMLTAIVAATVNLALALYRESAPIEWKTFTYAEAEKLQHEGKTVVFFGNATYNVESQVVRKFLDGSRVATAAHRGEIVPLIRTYDAWDDSEIRSVWKRVGHTKRPMILLFKPDRTVTQMEPMDFAAIERQVGSRSVLPPMPAFAFAGGLIAFVVARCYVGKVRTIART